MVAPEPELWAVCEPCDRSFFVSSGDAAPADVMCPVCAAVPERAEQRVGERVVAVQALTPDALI